MCKQQTRLAYSAVDHKKLKIIKLEWLHYANLFFISLLEHFTAECTVFFLSVINADILVC